MAITAILVLGWVLMMAPSVLLWRVATGMWPPYTPGAKHRTKRDRGRGVGERQ